MNLLCWLFGHKEGKWEMSRNEDTHKIIFHCARCQKPMREVENETLLTDKEYEGFVKIFERGQGEIPKEMG